jgi:PmbA protein
VRTSRTIAATAIAGDGTRMERDYWYRSATHDADLPEPAEIGRIAGERAVRRLEPRKVASQSRPVVVEPRVAAGFIGHILGAINGAAVARKTSFLRSRMGEAILAPAVTIRDDPFVRRGRASRPFDGEGIAGEPLDLSVDGVLAAWTLDCASARELGLSGNGRARRGLGNPAPGSTNITVSTGEAAPDDLLREIGTGLYVTDLIGQGVNLVTGDYSRGAAGYWIEGGELTYPVSEITIAGKLEDMFKSMRLADDATEFSAITVPTIAMEGVTIGGR